MSKAKSKKMYEIDHAARKTRRRKAQRVTHDLIVHHEDGRTAELTTDVPLSIEQAEARQIVATLERSLKGSLEFYKSPMHGELSHDAAVKELDAHLEYARGRIAHEPINQITWSDISAVGVVDLTEALKGWERIRLGADDELVSGFRAARVVNENGSPFALAEYLALRDHLADALKPQNGFESSLVDMMTSSFSLHLYWQEIAHQRAVRTHDTQRKAVARYEDGGWKSPFQSEADGIDQAHKLAGSYLHQFLKVARGLRDWRRHAPIIVNQHGGQVNVGGQQVNVSK